MTKENLRDLFCKQLNSSQHWGDLSIFDEFFDSNVVIPKGANRHIDADILHKWVEDVTLKVYCKNSDYGIFQTYNIKTYQPKVSTYTLVEPSEPVWEYQWVYGQRGNSSHSARLSEHCTINELFTKFTDDIDVYFYMPVDETKRERR